MQPNECIYVPGMSLCVGVQASSALPLRLERERNANRIVILSADAPEWAMVAVKPPASAPRSRAH